MNEIDRSKIKLPINTTASIAGTKSNFHTKRNKLEQSFTCEKGLKTQRHIWDIWQGVNSQGV